MMPRKSLKQFKMNLFNRKPESFLTDMKEMRPLIETLVQLVQCFSDQFNIVKTEKGLVDFADLEHFCLDILLDPSAKREGILAPSEALFIIVIPLKKYSLMNIKTSIWFRKRLSGLLRRMVKVREISLWWAM